ncbi:MAG TPA: M1 family aminopeptidase [Gemmatimonadales bacterium]|nr:M1 family aminopeptidase [Gemmatimonadales bacterium]
MKLREVFRYELEHRVRSGSTWIYAGILFLATVWMFLATSDGETAHLNSAVRLAQGSIIPGMFGMLVTAAIFGDAALRDVAVGMDPLLFTAPLAKSEYLGGRFLAALTANAAVVLAIPLGLLAVTGLLARFDPGSIGPLRVVAYLQPYLLFLLPNLVVIGALLFTVGMLARQAVPVYLTAIGLFVAYLIAANTLGQTGDSTLAALTDPFGLRTLEGMTRYWTVAEQNSRLVGFPATVMLNRVAWLAVAAGMLALLLRTFRFAHPNDRRRKGEPWRTRIEAEAERLAPVAVPRVTGSFDSRTPARQTLAVARNALGEIMASRWFVAVMVACVGLTLLWGWNVGSTVFDTTTWPVTFLVGEEVLSGRVAPVLHLFVALYAGELVWKEREVGAAELADASPVPEGAALLGRFAALVAMVLMFQAATLLGAILVQTLQGYYHLELGLYFRVVFGINLAHYVLVAALAMAIHVLVNQKYLGHMIVVLAMFFPLVAPAFTIRHNLLRYGMDPGWIYSDMNGFGPFMEPLVWFKLYWAGWALLLMVGATALWVRGREPGLRHRLRVARARLAQGGTLVRATGLGAVLILMAGGLVFYNTNVLNTYRSSDAVGEPQAEYEKRYGRFEGAPQPAITSADLRVEIYPEEPAVDLRGTFHLLNRSAAAIDSVHLVLKADMEARWFRFDRAARPALTDAEVGYRIYVLDRALAPGDSLQLRFEVSWRPRGFTNGRMPTTVVRNGTYLDRRWLPFIGYQAAFELSDDEARQRVGLEPLPAAPGPGDAAARLHRNRVTDADLVQVNAVLGTGGDQIAVTPGVLRRSWTENGRRYFHYQTERPTSFGASMFSGRYAVREDRWRDVPLRIFHHPAHAFNLDRMVRSMKASLQYFSAAFGPYPDSHLGIVEIPRYDSFCRAHPNTIACTEDTFLTRVDGDEFDMAFFATAHEVAHTWWGGQVRGATGVRGQGFLTESLANYSAMILTEHTYGPEAARRVYDFQLDRYLRRRAEMGRDAPLLEVEDQPWIFYGKGAVALYLLRDHIGVEPVHTALRRYFEKHREGKPPFPTSLDLYTELRTVTPDSVQYLLTDLFETITLWDVRAERARVEPSGQGEYQVTIEVVAKKVRADSVGRETEVSMDDLIEIGVFAPGESGGPGEPLHLGRHRIKSGAQTIRVMVPRAPARAGVDPYRKLIDRQRGDNLVEVDAAGRGPASGSSR